MSSLEGEANSNRACYNPKRQNMKPRTPFLLYLLAIFFVLATLIHLFGVIQTVQSWNWLRAIDYQPGPIYTVFKNIFLFLAFLCAAIFLLLRFAWATLFDGIVVVINAIWFWIDRLVLTQNPLPFKGHLLTSRLPRSSFFSSCFPCTCCSLSCIMLQPALIGNTPGGEDE